SASSSNSADVYKNNAITSTGAMVQPRARHTMTLRPDGTVVVDGGQITNTTADRAPNGEIFTPGALPAGTFTDAGPMVYPRQRGAATLLADNSVLFTGGIRNIAFLGARWAAADRFKSGGGFVGAPNALVTRGEQGAVLLGDGRVMLAGGSSDSGGTRQAGQTIELYQPPSSTDLASSRPSIENPNLPDSTTAVAYPTVVFTGTGGTSPYSFAIVSGALPPGVKLVGNTISDDPLTAKVAGAYYFGVRVTDGQGHIGVQTLRIRLNAFDITTLSLPNAFVGQPYGTLAAPITISATGVGAKTFKLLPGQVLPAGLTLLSSGTISGTPTTTGFFSFNVEANDSLGQLAYRQLSISVQTPLTILTTSLADGVIFENVSGCVSTGGSWQGTRTFTMFAANGSQAVPPGLSMDSTNGCFLGSVTAFGHYTFTVQVEDQASPHQIPTQVLSLHVALAVDQSAGGSNPSGVVLNFGGGPRLGQRFTAGVAGF